MKNDALRWLGHMLLVAGGAAVFAACSEAPAGPDRRTNVPAELDAVSAARAVDLGTCTNLSVTDAPAVHAYAKGVQIYRWNGTAWVFVAPSAELYADAGGHGQIGTHYAGPTWESVSGSKVVGAVIDRCAPSPNAIPWLKLGAVSASGPGIFSRIAFIQRVNTVGGTAPTTGGTVVGEEARVPYTAEYYFYRAP
jgi:Protein of unknown function (DUF3455)